MAHYDSSELTGQNPNTLELYRSRNNGAAWNNLGGTVNTVARTITVSGINDFSRWTAADSSNRIGTTAAASLTGISPASKSVGDPAFTLTVNGTEFVNGKSTVRFNGNGRSTTYVSTTQLTASISASDLLAIGSFPITVSNAGGGFSNSVTFTVGAGAPATISVETISDGSGTIAPAESLASGAAITVYAITRDASHNFVANVAASAWGLQNITGSVVAGDLVPAADSKSAVFTAHGAGSAIIAATSGLLTGISSGTITVKTTTGVVDATRPIAFDLKQNYPNPFNPTTVVSFQLPVASDVLLVVYDLLGREVAVLVNERREAGVYEVNFNAVGLASGAYIYRLTAGSFVGTKKLLLLR